MKVLITGATGFVGSHLAEALAKQGDEVYCLVRRQSNLRWLQRIPVKYLYGEMLDTNSLNDAVKDKDIIYNVAGIIKARNRDEYEKGNYIATKNLIETVYQYNRKLSRFVHISSLAVVGPCLGGACHTEETTPCPITDYGQTKLKGETEVKKYAGILPVTIIRPPVVYGPRDTGLYLYFKVVSKGIKPLFRHNKSVSLIHIDDLVRGIILSATNPKAVGATYFITNNEPMPVNHLADLIVKTVGRKVITLYIPDKLVSAAASVFEAMALFTQEASIFNRQKAKELTQELWGCLNDRARRELGFQPLVTLPEGFLQTARWYKQQGWI